MCRIGCSFFCFSKKFWINGLLFSWKLFSIFSFLMVFNGRFCVLLINSKVWWFVLFRLYKKILSVFKILVFEWFFVGILNLDVIIFISLFGDSFGVIIWVVVMLFLIFLSKLFVMVVFLVLILLVIIMNFLVWESLYCR